MARKRLWNLVSVVVVLSLTLGACGARPTPTASPTARPTSAPTSEPIAEPTAVATRPPQAILPLSDAAPAVIQQSPAPGAELALDGAVELVFNQPMNRAAVEAAFHIEPRVAGSFEWTDDRIVSFKPAEALPRAGLFQVSLGQAAAAVNGATLNDDYRFRFAAVGYLQVSQVLPGPDTADVEPSSTITVIFNRPVVPLTTLEEQSRLPQPLVLEPAAAGKGEWLNTSIYVFVPDQPLVGGTSYTARISAGLSDTTGGLLEQDYTWSFTTRPPVIVWHDPGEDQELVSVDREVTVTFNQPMDAGSVGAAFSLFDAAGNRVPGLIGVDREVVTLKPESRLAYDTSYRVQIKEGVLARGGTVGMAEPFEWRFTTVPLPRILRTEPADGEKNAYSYTDLTVYFNAPIDPATVMPNIRMTPPISASQVYTYYRQWDQSFGFGFGAQPSTDYQVEIGSDIADPYGNRTGQSLVVRFRTRGLDPMVQLVVPDAVGTYNANDPARVFAAHLNVSRLDATLFRLSPDRFFDLQYRWGWEQFKPGSGDRVRSWSQPVEGGLNETAYTRLDLVEGGGRLEPGLYYLMVDAPEIPKDTNGAYGTRHVLVVSRLNLTIKRAENQLLVWATDLATGEPVSGLELVARKEDGASLTRLATGSDGTALVDPGYDGALWILSEQPFALGSEYWERGINVNEFGMGGGDWAQQIRAHIYTDRPIYRPDQTVHFRGVLRAEDDASYSPVGAPEVEVVIRNPNWEEVYRERLPLSDYGGFYGELELPAGAPLGDYNIEANLRGNYFGQSFQVAAYRAPQFEVLVSPAESDLVAGESAQVAVEVKTFFGSPVAEAAVAWNVLADVYRFAGLGSYSYSASDDPWGYYRWWWQGPMVYPEPILSGGGTTDRQGRLLIEVPADLLARLVDEKGSQIITVEATVYGADNSAISGRGELTVHQGDYYVGVAPREYVSRAGDETAVDLIVLDWQVRRLPGVALTAELYRREYKNSYVETETGGYWEWQKDDVLVGSQAITSDSLGEAEVPFTPPEGGTYRVLVSGIDAGGRTVRSSAFFWATSPETISWQRENNDRINLITDKLSYLPGETAEILIPSPFEGRQWALITVERADVKQYQVVKMETNSYVYRLPITAGHAPNVFVSAVVVKGQDAFSGLSDYRVGYAALEVSVSEQELTVALTPSPERAEPGETVRYDLLVTDSRGEPVQGEFSLDLVDKAVLTLQPRTPNAIVNAFYGPRACGVRTASGLSLSVNRLVEQQMDQMVRLAGVDDSVSGNGGRDAVQMEMPALPPTAAPAAAEWTTTQSKALAHVPAGVEVRQEFADTAYWNPSVVTDQSGRAVLEVGLPDNLTTWTARAVGLTADTRVGEGTVEVVSSKPLLIRPVTPRFLVVGDRVQLAAIVNNNTDQELLVDVALGVAGVRLAESEAASQQIPIAAQSEAKVTWWAIAEDVEYADLVFSAASGPFADASRPTLATGPDQIIPVYRYAAPEVVGTAGQLAAAGTRTEIIALPPRFDERQGDLRLEIDPSLAAGMRAGLDYLEHYEYECIEQTVSRFLPNILTLRALRKLGLQKPELEARLAEQLAVGLERLYLGQNPDGGWGWWPKQESAPHVSAYVVFALNEAARAGFDVRRDVIGRGADFMASKLVAPRELRSYQEANRQAWLLFVLNEYGRDVDQRLADLYQNREKLSHYGRAFLAIALGADDARTRTLLADLNNAAILSATGAHWEESEHDWWAMNTDTRSSAVILDALTRLDPENEMIPNVVRWLMVARKEGIWETTQETAWALIALTDWMAYTGELAADFEWASWLNGQEWTAGRATAENVDQPVIVTRALAELLRDQGNELVIGRAEGPGRLYYTAHLRAFLPVEEVEAANRGIVVTRQYIRADCEQGSQCPPISEARVGDEIRVRLTIIAPNSLYYLVVEDPLPAGAEAIDPSLATTSVLADAPLLRGGRGEWDWWWNWYSHSELRDEKVVLFADYLAAGTYEYTYTIRATVPGEFRVMPAFANEFYFPEVFGRTDGTLFTIAP